MERTTGICWLRPQSMAAVVFAMLAPVAMLSCEGGTPTTPTETGNGDGNSPSSPPADISGNWYLTAARNQYEGDSCVADIKQQVTALEQPHLVSSDVPVTVEQSGSRITWTFPHGGCFLPGVVTGNTFALPFEDVVEACFASLTLPTDSGFPTPWQGFPPPWQDVCEVPWRMTGIESPDPAFRGTVVRDAITLTAVYTEYCESQRNERDNITWTTVQTYRR